MCGDGGSRCVHATSRDGNLEGSEAAGSLRPMTERRVLPLLVGLWAASAAAQTPVAATVSITLDGGSGVTSAYVVTAGAAAYAMANAGQDLEVFATTAPPTLFNSQPGTFSTFAVADQFPISSSATTTLVFAADVGAGAACSLSACVDAFLWSAAGFFPQTQVITTGITAPLAMTVDTTTPGTIRVYFSAGGSFGMLYEQDFVPNAAMTGLVAKGTTLSRSIATTGGIVGLTVDGNAYPTGLIYINDGSANMYTTPKDYVSNPAETLTPLATVVSSGYDALEGIFFYVGGGYLLGGGDQRQLVYGLSATAVNDMSNIVFGTAIVQTQGGGRTTSPFSVSYSAPSGNPLAGLTLVTETATPALGPDPFLHVVTGSLFPDAGLQSPDAGGGVDAGTPTIPIVPPGPGQLTGTANGCNCSSAGGAPALLVLLLPLLAPRRRR